MEVNPRLQVEHTVTEAVTGIDIVKEQLRIAAGRALRHAQADIVSRGWALECRILAEDPDRGFAPSVGRINRLREPAGPGVRVDSGVAEGVTVTPHYDSLLAKLIAWGETRAVAIVRMRRALEEYQIAGVTTTLRLYRALLDSTRFLGGQFHTGFVEEKLRGDSAIERKSDRAIRRESDQAIKRESEWEAGAARHPYADQRLAAAVTAALLEHRRRQADEAGGRRVSRWKMLGRWERMRRGGGW